MSGHPAEPGSRPRRPAGPAIAAAAAAIVLAVAACTGTSTPGTTGAPASAVAAASTGPGGHAPALAGSGSTFDAPFFSVAFAKYRQQHPGVTIGYAAVGSSAGIAAISARQVDFGASDVPMTASEQAAATGGPITQVPVDLGGEGIAYHLALPIRCAAAPDRPGPRGHLPRPDQPLERPGHHRAQPRPVPPARADQRRAPLRRQRHHLHLQQLPVRHRPGLGRQGRHRQDTELAGREPAEGNGGVATAVNRTPFSIGYMQQAYSTGLLLPFAAIRNQAGNYVIPSTRTVTADAAQKPAITPADFSIVNQPGATSYPISGYSWALVYTRQPSQATGQALAAMLDWLTHDGQAYAAASDYVPLPAGIQQLAHTMLQQVTGPTGTHLLS